jgi:hypothetical protein
MSIHNRDQTILSRRIRWVLMVERLHGFLAADADQALTIVAEVRPA